MDKIVLLGSTGSIGTQTLDVCRAHNIGVKALSANSDTELLEKQAREFCPEYAVTADESCYGDLKARLADTNIKVLAGEKGLCEIAALKCGKVVNAIVGMAGLVPTLSAIRAGNDVALANKETLVTGGKLVTDAVKRFGVKLLPIDSEHSAIFQCLQGAGDNRFSKIILTASGGPFFGKKRDELLGVTKEQALNHPNWDMGAKITIDSATLMNKGLEIIEAHHLFNMPYEKIDVIVHPQSVVHSAIEYKDGSVIAQLGVPSMHIPIQYAISYPERYEGIKTQSFSFSDVARMDFDAPDFEKFPSLNFAYDAGKKGGSATTSLNAINEEAVFAFLRGEIKLCKIYDLIESLMPKCTFLAEPTIDEIFELDREARELTRKSLRF